MALNYKGEHFVIALNQLGKSATIGDTYRVFNDGHLDLGRLNVERGNFVSWNGSGWQLEPSIQLLNTLDLADIQALVKQALAYTETSVSPAVANNKIDVALNDRSILTVNLPNNSNGKQINISCDGVTDAYIILKPTASQYIVANKVAFLTNNVAMTIHGAPVVGVTTSSWDADTVAALLKTTSLTPMDEPEIPTSFGEVDVVGYANTIVTGVNTTTFTGNRATQKPIVYHVVGALVYLCAMD